VAMVLVDTSIWIDHLHKTESTLVELLDLSLVCIHPMIIGELALGSIKRRTEVLALLANLPSAVIASHEEVLRLVEARRMYGEGLSLVDAHLLAATRLTSGAALWTRDKRLRDVAVEEGIAWRA
jgi:predicted nucleic acid-binding protein